MVYEKNNKKGELSASNFFGKDEWAPFAGAMAGMWMDDVEMYLSTTRDLTLDWKLRI